VIAAGGAAAGAVGGLALGAALGSAVPVIGTLIGAGIGLLAGAIGGGIAYGVSKNSETDAETAAIQRLGEEYSKKGASAVTDEEIQKLGEAEGWSQDLIDQLKNNSEEVKKLCSEMAANTAATNAENMAMAGQILADNETVQNSQYKDDIAVFAGATYGKVNNEAYDKYMGDDYKANWLGIGKQG
jgi:phage tail tape-measure protein